MELFAQITDAAIVIALFGLISAFIGLDYIAIGQTMLAQPAVCGVLLGLVIGEPVAGLWSGIVFQFLWSGKLPIGKYVPPNAFNAAVFTVICVAAMPSSIPVAFRVVGSASLGILVGIIGGRLDVLVKRSNDVVVTDARAAVDSGDFSVLTKATLTGVFRFFAKDLLLMIPASTVGVAVVWGIYTLVGERLLDAMELAFRILPAIAIGAGIRGFFRGRNIIAFTVGIVVAIIALVLFNFDIIGGWLK